MSIRTVCLRLPAAGFQQCSSRLPHWRSAQTLRMCTSMAQEQVSQHSLDKWLATLPGCCEPVTEGFLMSQRSAEGHATIAAYTSASQVAAT